MQSTDSPYISVIIVAYNRKQYLLNAIKSVLSQNIPRKDYEIILVKNFSDGEIDKFLIKNEVVSILVNDIIWGESLCVGIKRAKGNAIVFLDDDDEFECNKLRRIFEVFKSFQDIVYYHNSFGLISFKGEELSSPLYSRTRKTKVFSVEDHREIIKILRQGMFLNLSSIAARRSFILANLNYIKELSAAVDVFLFFMALDSGERLFFDHTILTKYYIRKHSAMHSIGDFDTFIKSANVESKNEYETYKFLSSCLTHPYLLAITNGIGRQWKILRDSISTINKTSDYIKEYLLFMRQSFYIRPRYTVMLSLVVLIRVIFRNRARFIFYILRTKLLLV